MDKDLKHKAIPADVLPTIEKQKQVVQVIVKLLSWITENPLEQKVRTTKLFLLSVFFAFF